MNRTIVGRITQARGARRQIETFLRQATELGDWAPIAVPFLLYVFGKTYQNERQKMREERVGTLKREKAMFDRVERQVRRELRDDATRRGVFRGLFRRRGM